MSRLQGASIAALLALVSAGTHADTLLVNTTDDEDNVIGKQCSLREAVSFVHSAVKIRADLEPVENAITAKNLTLSNLTEELKLKKVEIVDATGAAKTQLEADIARIENDILAVKAEIAVLTQAKQTIVNEMTALQIYGCIPTSTSTTDEIVIAPSDTAYKLTTPITIMDPLVIKWDDSTKAAGQLSDNTSDDLQQVHLKVQGNHSAFILDDGVADIKKRLDIRLTGLKLEGCQNADNSKAACAVNGGLIINRESLSVTESTLFHGGASQKGGAIYNDTLALLHVANTSIERNFAPSGAAIHSEQAGVSLQQSLVAQNDADSATGTVIRIASGTIPTASGTSTRATINDSTISSNTGVALSVPREVRLLGLTVVANSAGVDFGFDDVNTSNSIIAGNGSDCLNVGATTRFKNNLFISAGCPTGLAADGNRRLTGSGDEKLFAGSDSLAATCDAPPAKGLLCPLGNYGGSTRTHKPRLLVSYNVFTESPIVNKGNTATGTADYACSTSDQRGQTRSLCDIGAVELITTNQEKQGQDVISGDIVRFDMREKIGDGELLPEADCEHLVKDPRARMDIDGCPIITAAAQKGTLSFDNATHQVIYSPDSVYHGFDRFSYAITTTLSRFSDATNKQTLTMSATVVAEPAGGIGSKTYAGSFGSLGLSILAGLALLRRRMRGGQQ